VRIKEGPRGNSRAGHGRKPREKHFVKKREFEEEVDRKLKRNVRLRPEREKRGQKGRQKFQKRRNMRHRVKKETLGKRPASGRCCVLGFKKGRPDERRPQNLAWSLSQQV